MKTMEDFTYSDEMVEIYNEVKEGADFLELINEIADRLCPVYYSEQIDWIRDDPKSFEYLDDVMTEYRPENFSDLVSTAIYNQKRDELLEEWGEFLPLAEDLIDPEENEGTK